MIFKNALSTILATSLIVPATLPSISFAQAANPALVSPANDSIAIILQALNAKSPDEAKVLLASAQQKAIDEKLPPETLANVQALIATASSKLNLGVAGDPLAGAAPNTLSTITPAITPVVAANNASPDTDAVIAKLMQQNPDLHATMRAIGIGRLQRDSSNLDAIVQATTTQSVSATDIANSMTTAALGDAGALIKALRSIGVLHNWTVANKALRDKNDRVPVDVLAEEIIRQSAEWSILAGAVKRIANSSGTSVIRGRLGVTAEALGVYAINADLVLRLADLYGMNLTESQQDVAILAILPIAKMFIISPKEKTAIKAIAEKLGALFAQVKANPNPSALGKFYVAVFESPLMAGIAKKLGIGSGSITAKSDLGQPAKGAPAPEAAAHPAAPVEAPVAAPAAGGLEQAVVKVEAAAVAAEKAAAPVVQDAAKVASAAGTAAAKVAKAPLSMKMQVAWLMLNMVQSGLETYATGWVAKHWFSYEKSEARKLETSNFHNYLMSEKSHGFFKLMIAAINSGSEPSGVIDVRTSKDPRAKFIMHIAQSVRICSTADADRFRKLKVQSGGNQMTKAKNMVDADYRLLRFQCDTHLGHGVYDEIAKEFMTFDSIPEWTVASLRLANYSDRMQMGELIMQLQFLNGEPTDQQNQFFQTTVMKILGLTRIEDANYFSHFYAFIRERGGMVENISNPTGYAIDDGQGGDPYMTGVNYTTAEGMDMPSPPPVPVVPPTTAATATTPVAAPAAAK